MKPKLVRVARPVALACLAALAASAPAAAADRVVLTHTGAGVRAVLAGHRQGAVVFLLNGRRIHRAAHAPYTTRLRARALVGHNELTAQAAGTGALAAATLTPSAPTVAITAAPPAETSDPTATLAFSTQNAKVVQCRVDDQRYAACRTPDALSGLAPGQHIFRVRALNSAGHAMASASWTVTDGGGGDPPGGGTVSLTAPAAGATLSGAVTLTADASAAQGRVAWVDFLVDGRVVGSDSSAPYAYPL